MNMNKEIKMKRICNVSAQLAATGFADKMTDSKINKISYELETGVPFRSVLDDYAELYGGNVRKVPNKNAFVVTFIDKNGNVKKLRY